MTNSRLVWFQLYDAGTGLPFNGVTATRVSVSTTAIVVELRKAVKSENPNKLSHVDANDLLVYKNKTSFDNRNLEDGREVPLKSSCSLNDLGKTEKDALVVAVPSTGQNVIPMEIGLTPFDVSPGEIDKVRSQLCSLIRLSNPDKNFFLPHESIKCHNPEPDSPLKLKFYSQNSTDPDLLYSEQIYDDLVGLGIQMPSDTLAHTAAQTSVLIGVTGCGKTRTCYDLARHKWVLYFDCYKDADMQDMSHVLSIAHRSFQPLTDKRQEQFEQLADLHVFYLLGARLFVLDMLLKRHPNLSTFDWLCIQRDQQNLCAFSNIYSQLQKFPLAIIFEIVNPLILNFRKNDKFVIFDESQELFSRCKDLFRSSKKEPVSANGQLTDACSLFSFLARQVIITYSLKSIWCGTRMRIQTMELVSSAGGRKASEIEIFSDFTFLESHHIKSLLKKWVKTTDTKENELLLEKICHLLQGRPRYLCSFLREVFKCANLKLAFDQYIQDMTTKDSNVADPDRESPYFFWKANYKFQVVDYLPNQPVAPEVKGETSVVGDNLLKLCLSYLFGASEELSFKPRDDMVNTNLVTVINKYRSYWYARMAEPLTLTAGLNFLKDYAATNLDVFTRHFANQLFAPLNTTNLTPQARGSIMKLLITVNFCQAWWERPSLRAFLPPWAQEMDIPSPRGVLNCRMKTEQNHFIQQLLVDKFEWIVLPPTHAGPDIHYSIFSVNVKTTWGANSRSPMFVSSEECKKNQSFVDPANWYKSISDNQELCNDIITEKNSRFVHFQFELPNAAPNCSPESFSRASRGKKDHVLFVNLKSDFARLFFGDYFVDRYEQFVQERIEAFGESITFESLKE